MPSVQDLPIQSSFGDNESLKSSVALNVHQDIIDIAAQPDFNVFTSMLWIRWPAQDPDKDRQSEASLNADGPTVGKLQPDLGLLRFHRDRMADAAEAIGWRDVQVLQKTDRGLDMLRSSISHHLRCLPEVPQDRVERRKLRLVVSKKGVVGVDSAVMDSPFFSECGNLMANWPPQSLDLDLADAMQSPYHKLCQVFVDTQPCKASVFTTHKTSHREHYNAARKRANVTTAPTEKEVIVYNQEGEVMEASLSTVYFFRDNTWITPAAICGGNLGVTRRLALEEGLCKQGNIEVEELQEGEKVWLSNAARGFFVGQIHLGTSTP